MESESSYITYPQTYLEHNNDDDDDANNVFVDPETDELPVDHSTTLPNDSQVFQLNVKEELQEDGTYFSEFSDEDTVPMETELSRLSETKMEQFDDQQNHYNHQYQEPTTRGQSGRRKWSRGTSNRNNEKIYTCTENGCGRVFRNPSHLKDHHLLHTGEKPFECSTEGCEWKFRRADELRRHIRRHTGEKPFTCAICSASFYRRDHWRKHMTRHPNAKDTD